MNANTNDTLVSATPASIPNSGCREPICKLMPEHAVTIPKSLVPGIPGFIIWSALPLLTSHNVASILTLVKGGVMSGSKKNRDQRARVMALNEHLTPAEIGTRLGISRQRVYQILSDEGTDYLTLNRKHQFTRRVSRNLVRSLSSEIAHVDKATRGAIGELIAAADLLSLGWKPYVPLFRNHGHDIIALKGAAMISIEVRIARRKDDESLATRRTKAAYPAAHHFAFVLSDEPVIYEPALPQIEVEHKTRDRGGPSGRRPTYTDEQIRGAMEQRERGVPWRQIATSITNGVSTIGISRLQARVRELKMKDAKNA